MSIANFSGSSISSTYNRLVQTDGNVLADGTGSLLQNLNIPNLNVSGNLFVSGTLYAENQVIVTQSYYSGSNIFGDELTDTQQFTGSVLMTGSLAAFGDVEIISSSLIVKGDSWGSSGSLSPSSLKILNKQGGTPSNIISVTADFGQIFRLDKGTLYALNSGYTSTNRIYLYGTTYNYGDLGVGTANLASARLHVKGAGTTSATTALLVQDANASSSFQVYDSGVGAFGTDYVDHSYKLNFSTPFNTNTNGIKISNGNGYLTLRVSGDQGFVQTGGLLNLSTNVSTTNLNVSTLNTRDNGRRIVSLFENQSNQYGILSIGTTTRYETTAVTIQAPNAAVTNLLTLRDSSSQPLVNISATSSLATVEITGSLTVSGSSTFRNIGPAEFTGSTSFYKSGSTVLNVEGSSGQLFSITDSLTGSLFSVNTVAGLPVIEVFSDNTVNIGKFGVYPIKVVNSGSSALITGSITSAETASYVNPLVQNVVITGSLLFGGQYGGTIQASNRGVNLYVGYNTIYGGSSGTDTAAFIVLRDAFGSQRNLRIKSDQNIYIGTRNSSYGTFIGGDGSGLETVSAKLHIKGEGTTSLTTSLLIQNANASASLAVLDDGTTSVLSSNELPFTVSHTNGSSTLGFVLGNGSQLAPGFTALRLNNSLNVFTFSSGRITTPLPLTVGGPTDTFRISGGGGGSDVANPAIFLTDNTYNAGGYTVTSGTQTTVQIGGFGAPSNSIWKPASGTANYTLLAVAPNISGSGTYSGTIRGIYYNPTVDSTTYGAHKAIETTAGDVVFNNAELYVSDTGTSGVTHNLLFRNDNNSYGGIYISSTGQQLSIQQGGGYGYLGAAGFYIGSANGAIWTNNGSIFRVVNSAGTTNYFRIHDTTGNVSINSSTDAGSKLHVKGSGTTNATTALLVQNANASASMVVLDDGAVGIGTTSPGTPLDVTGAGRFSGFVRSDFLNTYDNSKSIIGNPSNYTLIYNGSGTETIRINSSGYVGIGTTTPSASLHVSGSTLLYKSGSTVLDVQGSQGQLFSVVDSLTGSLMSVNDISGLPILEVFSDDRVEMGTYGAPALIVTGSSVISKDMTISSSLTINGNNTVPPVVYFNNTEDFYGPVTMSSYFSGLEIQGGSSFTGQEFRVVNLIPKFNKAVAIGYAAPVEFEPPGKLTVKGTGSYDPIGGEDAVIVKFASTDGTNRFILDDTGSATINGILTLTPQDPLPSGVPTGSFAVSSSVPPKPYFFDGTSWNSLY